MSKVLIGVVIGLVVAGVVALVNFRSDEGLEVEAKEMEEITITVDSKLTPRIPFAKIVAKPDPSNPSHDIRAVRFKTEGGTATVVIPVEGIVGYPQAELVAPPSRVTVLQVDTNGTTLIITEKNEKERTVKYQVLCDDGTTRYWAQGESPPRIIIPPGLPN